MLIVKSGQDLPKNIAIKTPSFGLNNILGGGLWTGRFHYFWGPRQVGKTTFCLNILAEAQRLGYKVIIVDTEQTMTDQWTDRSGIDRSKTTDLYTLYQGSNLEEILRELIPEMKRGKCAVMVDSMNNLVSEAFFDKADGNNSMAMGAKARGKFLQRVSEVIHPTENIVLCVSQQTTDIGGQYAFIKAKMSEKEDHDATNIIRLQASKSDYTTDDDGTITHKKVKWTISKSKQAAVEGAAASYWIDLSTSQVDRNKEIIDLAVKNGVISKGGAWFSYGDKKYHGLNNVALGLTSEDMADIEKELNVMKNITIDDGTGESIDSRLQ